MEPPLLANLNPAQAKAVQHPPDCPLQILAGPGSGKTRVLTSRIAYLIVKHHIPASSICAVTFTNKAANEMRERLRKLIGKDQTGQLKLGTFHALCALFLRKHGRLIGLDDNFTICNADESLKIIRHLITKNYEFINELGVILKEGLAVAMISQYKSKGQAPDDMDADAHMNANTNPFQRPNPINQAAAKVYRDYQETLRKNNSLDFDDLLVQGVKLFRGHKRVLQWCQHVLVDEFQDTNSMQYELMRYLGTASRCVTVVGDPDQSIYGWRSADARNLDNMKRDFPKTQQVLLEENYRSTRSILAISLAVISQDRCRIDKSLFTSNSSGPAPTLCLFSSPEMEALFMATEIKRLIALTGGMLTWKDFAILLRFNALSRVAEKALQEEGIPNRVLAGQRFFDRMEVKDLLAYLQLVDNPSFVPAFVRVVNVPARGLGAKSISEVLNKADMAKISPVALLERIHDTIVPDIKPAVKKKAASFVKVFRALRRLALDGASPEKLLDCLLFETGYEEHLKRTQQDWESRWENVKELIKFSTQVQQNVIASIASFDDSDTVTTPRRAVDEPLERDVTVTMEGSSKADTKEKAKVADGSSPSTSPLRVFLQASTLSTDSEAENGQTNNKVTISTCHAAKGLEWPVVMVPAVESDVYPMPRSNDEDEERRLLYVACTRAQGLLYLTYCYGRRNASGGLSRFISNATMDQPDLKSPKPPEMTLSVLENLAGVLRRSLPPQVDLTKKKFEFESSDIQARYNNAMAHSGEFLSQIQQEITAPISVFSFDMTSTTNQTRTSLASSWSASSTSAPTPPTAIHSRAKPASSSEVRPPQSSISPNRDLRGAESSFPTTFRTLQPEPRYLGHTEQTEQFSKEQLPSRPVQPSTAAARNCGPLLQKGPQSPCKTSSRIVNDDAKIVNSSFVVPAGVPNPSASVGSFPTASALVAQVATASSDASLRSTQLSEGSNTRTNTSISVSVNHPTARAISPDATASVPYPTPLLSPTITPAKEVSLAPSNGALTTSATTGIKRRLGMGRAAVGYANKKFKTPGQ